MFILKVVFILLPLFPVALRLYLWWTSCANQACCTPVPPPQVALLSGPNAGKLENKQLAFVDQLRHQQAELATHGVFISVEELRFACDCVGCRKISFMKRSQRYDERCPTHEYEMICPVRHPLSATRQEIFDDMLKDKYQSGRLEDTRMKRYAADDQDDEDECDEDDDECDAEREEDEDEDDEDGPTWCERHEGCFTDGSIEYTQKSSFLGLT